MTALLLVAAGVLVLFAIGTAIALAIEWLTRP